MLEAFREGFGRYADFSGRTARRPFWYFVTVTQLALVALASPLLLLVFRAMLFLSDEVGFTVAGVAAGGATPEEIIRIWAQPQDLLLDTWCYAAHLWMEQPVLHLISAVLALAFALLIICPSFAISARRLRDAGRSPWWTLSFVAAGLPVPGIMELGCLMSLYVLRLCALPTKQEWVLPPLPGSDQ